MGFSSAEKVLSLPKRLYFLPFHISWQELSEMIEPFFLLSATIPQDMFFSMNLCPQDWQGFNKILLFFLTSFVYLYLPEIE